jgi:predicted aldo/keto reductase-like oxidoreductase
MSRGGKYIQEWKWSRFANGGIIHSGARWLMAEGLGRRDWMKLGAAGAMGLLTARLAAGEKAKPAPPFNVRTAKAMPTRNLGCTGHQVGLFSLGCQAAIEKADNEAVAVPLIDRALDLGVNYLDTSARYGGEKRWSEQYVGKVMQRRRGEAFLATKTHDRTKDGSLKLLETSLKLLQTDHVDLWQLHALDSMDDVNRALAPDGAVQAMLKAREQGLVRYLGISGHTDPNVLMEAIRRFPFDTVLMGFNAADPHHLSFRKLLDLAVEKEMGIIGMKIPARGRLLQGYVPPPTEQPRGRVKVDRTGTITMKEAMRYALSFPLSTVIIGVDNVKQLEENVALARDFRPLAEAQLRDLEGRAKDVAGQSLCFRRDAPQNPLR